MWLGRAARRACREREIAAWARKLVVARRGGQRIGQRETRPTTAAPGTPLASTACMPTAATAVPSGAPSLWERFVAASKTRVRNVQDYFALAGRGLGFIFVRPFYGQDWVQQMDEIGVKSLGIVLLTGFFTGMVLALQSSVQLQTFGATMYIGRLVSPSMIRELA